MELRTCFFNENKIMQSIHIDRILQQIKGVQISVSRQKSSGCCIEDWVHLSHEVLTATPYFR